MMKKIFLFILLATLSWSSIDINSADVKTLTQLKGIGPVKAQAIVDYRKKHGKFKRVEELDEVKGIGPKTVEKIKSKVTVK
ncbi:helix-hairpin-helix domain-containing protein [Hydrogenimonas sp. SS33]|uniref:ComEA family DNA-binding protein n=1 Tax=Hydrogenimonas leucolamina TaxID=2954236 RepID=UPI00336C2D69